MHDKTKMKRNKINSCKLAIIKTLSYSGVFGYPLTFYQITNNLISRNRLPRKKIKKELENLVKTNIVKKTKGKYIISEIKGHDANKRKKNSQEIISENKPFIDVLTKIPWIKMIAITGSVANYDAKREEDIDLLFITEKDRLWITRGFVFLMLKVMGKLPKKENERKICPNIFIDESRMAWAKKKRNLYVAQNIISMQPLVWRDDTYFNFMEENKWIFKYFNNFKINFPGKNSKKIRRKSFLFRNLESLARKTQIAHMKNKITTEVLNDRLIHFNKNDVSKEILRKYKKILKKTIGAIDS